jgi:hypothetical protein
MKSLASLLSRAFLDQLLQNPVGWQFIYRKNDPQKPSITMTPTNLILANLTPHARNPPLYHLTKRQNIRLSNLYYRFPRFKSS